MILHLLYKQILKETENTFVPVMMILIFWFACFCIGRSRWVYYSDDKYGWDYDGSQIPAEW